MTFVLAYPTDIRTTAVTGCVFYWLNVLLYFFFSPSKHDKEQLAESIIHAFPGLHCGGVNGWVCNISCTHTLTGILSREHGKSLCVVISYPEN